MDPDFHVGHDNNCISGEGEETPRLKSGVKSSWPIVDSGRYPRTEVRG
jgi:hypothetical protein